MTRLKSVLISGKTVNAGLLTLRIGIGIMFILHGWPKLMAGPELWAGLGSQMALLGISFGFSFWGFMAAFAETVGGFLLIAGLLTRPAAFLMFFTMFMATLTHLSNGDGIKGASHALELGIVFLALIFTGPGKLSLDYLLFGRKK